MNVLQKQVWFFLSLKNISETKLTEKMRHDLKVASLFFIFLFKSKREYLCNTGEISEAILHLSCSSHTVL